MPAMLRRPVAVFAVSGALFVAACGGREDGGAREAHEQQVTPAQAVGEIGKVRAGLDSAMASLKAGDRAKATDTLAESYVEHFERVERPLENVDPKLKEELEETIAKDLRGRVKDGAPTAEVQRLVDQVKAQLTTAQQKLE
jgi:hypothetical protein